MNIHSESTHELEFITKIKLLLLLTLLESLWLTQTQTHLHKPTSSQASKLSHLSKCTRKQEDYSSCVYTRDMMYTVFTGRMEAYSYNSRLHSHQAKVTAWPITLQCSSSLSTGGMTDWLAKTDSGKRKAYGLAWHSWSCSYMLQFEELTSIQHTSSLTAIASLTYFSCVKRFRENMSDSESSEQDY